MANPTRFSRVGMSGRQGQITSEGLKVNSGDWAQAIIAFKPELVASTSQQSSGIDLARGTAISVFVDVRTPATGTTPTLTVGVSSAPDNLVDALDVSTAGIKAAGTVDMSSLGEPLEYAFGSADLVGLDCEVVIVAIGTENP